MKNPADTYKMDNSDLLKKNLDALYPRSPDLASAIKDAKKETAYIKPVPAKSGALSAISGSLWLHSSYDPLKEAERAANSLPEAELILVFGLGLGYLPRAALLAGKRVSVIESDASWLSGILAICDCSDLFKSASFNLILCPEGRGLLDYLEAASPASVAVLENNATMEAFPQAARLLHQQLSTYKGRKEINAATRKRFGHLWVRNLTKNFLASAELPGLERLISAYKGLPALVLAAGPSLDALLPKLPEMAERLVTICVDTALRSVLAFGIEPDFIIVVDPQYWNTRHLDQCSIKKSILLAESAVYPSILRMEARQKLLCASLYPLGSHIESSLGKKLIRLGAGGSVATTAWDLARFLGCSQVYMAGLDLSFPGGYSHAKASYFEQKAIYESRKLKPASLNAFLSISGGASTLGNSNDGGQVRSDKRLELYSTWFSSRMEAAKGFPSYNLSLHGLEIPGMPYIGADELLTLPKCRDKIKLVTAKIVEALSKQEVILKTSPEAALAKLAAALDRLYHVSEKAIKTAKKAKQLYGTELEEALEVLDQIDKEVLDSPVKDIAAFLLSDVQAVMYDQKSRNTGGLAKTMALYSLLSKSTKFHMDCLRHYYYD
ncbi:DUF115 domain-containing protein [Spirochaetota bacterium]